MVCIHGFPTASWDWCRVWEPLGIRYRLVAPDMIGFGFSAKPCRYSYSILDQATLIESLLASLGVERAHLLVHDYGDTVGQELLARFEARRATEEPGFEIRSICFLNGGLFPEVHRALRVQKLLLSPVGPLLSRLSNERAFQRNFTGIFGPNTRPGPDEIHDFWSLVEHEDGNRIGHLVIRYLRERLEHRDRWVGPLECTAVPLRLIVGTEDPVSGRHMAERYGQLVPNPDMVLLEGVGHYPQYEAPARVMLSFFEFVDRVESVECGASPTG